MRRLIFLLTISMFIVLLSSCTMFGGEEEMYNRYCLENERDTGCMDDGVPTGDIWNEEHNPDPGDSDPQPEILTVLFSFTDSTLNMNEEVVNGNQVDIPNTPIKDGFVFLGWYTSDTFENHFDFNQAIIEDTTIYGLFQAIQLFDASEPIVIYCNQENTVLDDQMMRILNLTNDTCNDTPNSLEEVSELSLETGNILTYGLFSQYGNSGTVTINGTLATRETIRSWDYAYRIEMEFINRDLWFFGEEWHIGDNDPYASAFASALQDFIHTQEGTDIIELYGGFTYDYDTPWSAYSSEYSYACGDTFLNFEEKPNLRIGVAPGIETIARELVAGLLDVCPNFTPNIEITDSSDIYRRVQGDLSAGNLPNYLHFGFADREFDSYDTEPTYGITSGTVTLDAIVFYVNSDNPVTDLENWQIWEIFDGTFLTWEDVINSNN